MIKVISKQLIQSGAKVMANYDWLPLINFTPENFWAATFFQIHPLMVICRKFSSAWKTFYCLSSNQPFFCAHGPLIRRCSPTCMSKPEDSQCGLSIASYALAYSAPMIPDAGLFCVETHHGRSYARHLHMHRENLSTCIPANSHIFPPGIPLCVSPQEFLHTTKLMFSGMPPYIPHPPIQKDPHSEISFPPPPLPSSSLYRT
ncbi:hypothetical protein O181_015357 [Austropuccinia psidii MF-1]|uniref:Uncharacterized protein n=1 Tax=Austropuccinia psidii MF-1 TaxID=1389203 RepID=A0A9Q3C205_9BASI|nr:hypothetical protein [Austropuccinia psidii MF-1]